jgi:hypothetical protein
MKRMRYTARFLLILTFALVTFTSPAKADYLDNPPPLSGWTHPTPHGPTGADSPQRHGIQLSGGHIVRSSPTIAEIDGNTVNHNEVAVGGRDGKLYVYQANGSLLWEKTIPGLDPNCRPAEQASGNPLIASAPAVGDIDGNGTPDVVVGYGSAPPTDNCAAGVAAFDGATGALKWNFTLRNRTWNASELLYGVWSSPAIADTDGDGKMEIAFGSFDRHFYLLSFDGNVRWIYQAADTVWSSPMFLNVDNDPQLEVIFGTDISQNPVLIPPTPNGGFVHAFDTAPRNPSFIEFQQNALTNPPWLWRTTFDQVIYSSPAAGELISSNAGLEIAVGAGCFFPEGVTAKPGRWVKILSATTGQVLQTLNAPECVQSSPALGDIDDDGQIEVVVNVGSSLDTGIAQSQIVAWDVENSNPKWVKTPISANLGGSFNDADGGDLQSPVIADVDGNGSLEVISANFWTIHILEGKTGNFLTCQGSDSCGDAPSLYAWGTVKATPAVGDVNGDGVLDVVMGGMHAFDSNDRGHLYAWTNLDSVINSPAGNQPAYSVPWGQFRRDATHSARLIPRGLALANTAFNYLIKADGPYNQSLDVGSNDGSNLNWTLSEVSDPNNILAITKDTGTTGGESARFSINGDGKTAGTYAATLRLSASGAPDVTITVNVRVVENLSQVFVPMVRR